MVTHLSKNIYLLGITYFPDVVSNEKKKMCVAQWVQGFSHQNEKVLEMCYTIKYIELTILSYTLKYSCDNIFLVMHFYYNKKAVIIMFPRK